ncbi:MAG: Rha family transcriptional regulator [Chromatiaceae bacterium]|nr:Rha family transcriptional regulator [Chromatiaceae bacterium]
MTLSLLPGAQSASMTSREIAELTGKRHADVMRDIREMISRLENFNQNNHDANLRCAIDDADQTAPNLDWHCETDHYIDPNGRAREQYRLDRDTTLCLVAGYDPVPRMRIIKRLEALESGQATQVAIGAIAEKEQTAVSVMQSRLSAAALLKVPDHIGQQEAVKVVRASVGVDYGPLLLAAPAQQDIPDEDEMLEPEDLARRLGMKDGRTANERLRDAGLQVKSSGQWAPTERGRGLCVRHAWTKGNKTGYNLKWRVSAVRAVLFDGALS